MDRSRRALLKVIATTAGATAAAGSTTVHARARLQPPPGAMGMLYDTTLCIGCKACVVACKDANGMATDPGPFEDAIYDAPIDLNGDTRNIIKLYREGPLRSYMKAQCMHCIDPACVAACMIKALVKDEVTGIVSYDAAYCVGCRYCMMSCPFNIPKFEFDKAVPDIVKCEMCRHRVRDAAGVVDGFTRYPTGQGPACCEVCPREAVIYGKRDELLEEARRRIAANPGRYFEDRIYGEIEAGGTQVLYLSHMPFEDIGLPSYGDRSVPHVAYSLQEGIYYKLPFVAPAALYAGLAIVMFRNRRAGERDTAGGGSKS